MNEAVMVGRTEETSPRFMARMAGVFYLMDFAFAPAMLAGSKFIVPGHAAVWADVFIELLTTENGGRKNPLALSNDSPGQYRPHLRVIGGSGELLGVAFMDGPDEAAFPGGSTNATVKCLYPGVSYTELVEGAKFEILEGPNVVGRGVVTRR